MTILVFYPTNNCLGWECKDFDCMSDKNAFALFWEKGDKLGARLYDMESHYGNSGELDQHLRNADDFETDNNEEEFNGGGWRCKVLHVPIDFVKKVIGI